MTRGRLAATSLRAGEAGSEAFMWRVVRKVPRAREAANRRDAQGRLGAGMGLGCEGGRQGERKNFKLRTSNFREAPNRKRVSGLGGAGSGGGKDKVQTSNSKLQGNPKLQGPRVRSASRENGPGEHTRTKLAALSRRARVIWDLKFDASLELRGWGLEFPRRCVIFTQDA